jgi:hypothetical protein
MVSNYNIGEPRRVDGALRFTVSPLSVIEKNYETLNVAYSNKIPVSCMPKTGIQEIFLNLDLDKLRAIDGDDDGQKQYLRKKTFALETDRVNIFIMRLTLKAGDTLEAQDIEYIHDILAHPYNDILIPPVIEWDKDNRTDKVARMDLYDNLFGSFIEIKNQTDDVKLGMMIPSNYPATKIPQLFNYYSDENHEPDLFVLDFGGARLQDKYTRISRLKRAANASLNDPGRKFLYGFNIKPWKKSREASISEEIRSFCCGIHALGPVRGRPSKFVSPSDNPFLKLPKAFLPSDFNYHRLNQQMFDDNVATWIEEHFDRDVSNPKNVGYRDVTAYNIEHVNSEGDILATFINNGEDRELISNLKKKPVYDELEQYNQQTTV